MNELSIPQIIELADGLKCVRLEDFLRERDEAQEKYFAMRDLSNNATEFAEKYRRERDKSLEDLKVLRFSKMGDPLLEITFRNLISERDELREKYDTLATEHMLEVNKLCNERDEALEKLAEAKREAENLARSIYRTEYSDNDTGWELLESVAGVISQIDNMYAGVREQRDEALEALQYIAHSGLPARFLEDFAREFLKKKDAGK